MRSDSAHRHVVTVFDVGQVAADSFREHLHADALANQLPGEALGVAFNATDGWKEIGRQDEDASGHPASTVRRSTLPLCASISSRPFDRFAQT